MRQSLRGQCGLVLSDKNAVHAGNKLLLERLCVGLTTEDGTVMNSVLDEGVARDSSSTLYALSPLSVTIGTLSDGRCI